MSKRICILIFSGYNQRAVIAFLRTVDNYDLNYAIIAKSDKDDIFLTEYKDRVLYTRKAQMLELDDIKNAVNVIKSAIHADQLLIAPSTEALNRFMLINRVEFEYMGCIVPLPDIDTYELISDKFRFSALCKEKGIPVPKEITLTDTFARMVAKPKQYVSVISGEVLSPVLIINKEKFIEFRNEYNEEDFYYQEFIDGRSLYLLYYYNHNGRIYKFSQENYAQQPEGKSIVAAISSGIHNSDISSKFEKLFQDMNYHGFIMVEIRLKGKEPYMIEANPRFWGPSQLFVDAGRNFFEVFLYDYGLIDKPPIFDENKKDIKYFWFGCFIETFRKNLCPVFYNDKWQEILFRLDAWISWDIYNRDDTRKIYIKDWYNEQENVR